MMLGLSPMIEVVASGEFESQRSETGIWEMGIWDVHFISLYGL